MLTVEITAVAHAKLMQGGPHRLGKTAGTEFIIVEKLGMPGAVPDGFRHVFEKGGGRP